MVPRKIILNSLKEVIIIGNNHPEPNLGCVVDVPKVST
jgi:hypothetical protein